MAISNIRTFVYSNIQTLIFSLAALTYNFFFALAVTSNRSAPECTQSVLGTCLFIFLFFFPDIVYLYTTRGWKILDYT
jgi:hypothetical protein